MGLSVEVSNAQANEQRCILAKSDRAKIIAASIFGLTNR